MIKIHTYKKDNGKWIAWAMLDEQMIMLSCEMKQELHAIRECRQRLNHAIYDCKHEWGEISEHTEHGRFGQTDYVVVCTCKHCGLMKNEVSLESIYDGQDG